MSCSHSTHTQMQPSATATICTRITHRKHRCNVSIVLTCHMCGGSAVVVLVRTDVRQQLLSLKMIKATHQPLTDQLRTTSTYHHHMCTRSCDYMRGEWADTWESVAARISQWVMTFVCVVPTCTWRRGSCSSLQRCWSSQRHRHTIPRA